MKQLYLLLSGLFFITRIFAQDALFASKQPPCTDNISFQADTAGKTHEPVINGIDQLAPVQNTSLFELRFYEAGLQPESQSAFIMTLDSTKKWHIRFFNHLNNNNNIVPGLMEHQVSVERANGLWCLLKGSQLLSLPDYNSIRARFRTFVLDTTALPYGAIRLSDKTDGMYYYFNLKTPHAQRSYGYANPHALLKQYSNVEELYNICAIIAIIKKYLGVPAIVY